MDKLDCIRAFNAVVETGGFTSAAAKLGSTPQLVSKYVRALEDELTVKLLHRTTRKVSLTEQGRVFSQRFQQLIEDFDDLQALARDERDAPAGKLIVSAPITFSETYLINAISLFADQYPEISIDIRLSDRFVDLVEEGVDVGLRVGALESSSLIARRLADVEIILCGSPDYFRRNPPPEHSRDLSRHDCVIDTNFRTGDLWPLAGGEVRVDGRFRVNSASSARLLAKRGAGVLMSPRFVVAGELASGDLVEILPGAPDFDLGLYAVYLERRHVSGKVRAFVDFMADHCRRTPP
ncbi:MAG: LysR family transcriptional regulator [Pseudomonadota bacterium]